MRDVLTKLPGSEFDYAQRLAEEKQIWMQAYCASLVGHRSHKAEWNLSIAEIHQFSTQDARQALLSFRKQFYLEDST